MCAKKSGLHTLDTDLHPRVTKSVKFNIFEFECIHTYCC